MTEEENVVRPHQEMASLTLEEKKYLLGVERGDVAGTRRVLQRAADTQCVNTDCVDPLGRSALLMAIDNENLEMVELLLEFGVETRDALLHAISEEFVEAVEALLDHEERTRRPGELHVRRSFSLTKQIHVPTFSRMSAKPRTSYVMHEPCFSFSYVTEPGGSTLQRQSVFKTRNLVHGH